MGVSLSLLQGTATPTPGVGPGELGDYLPLVPRLAWFLLGFLLTVLLGWYLVEPAVSRAVRQRNQNNPTLREAVSRYVRLFVLLLGVFVGIGLAGYGGFIADSALVVAAATLAVGVAGQTVIGSLISGLVLVADPEFNVGDYIEWEGGEGTVRSITLRVTRVHTPDGELVTIPNTVLTSQAVRRPFGRGRYRVVDHVAIAYEDDVDAAMRHLKDGASETAAILEQPSPSVFVDEFGGDAVRLRVHYWVENPTQEDLYEVRSRYARTVKTRLEDAGVTISPPSKRDLEGRIEVDDPGT